jgi:pyridoxine/pyridoxamine 5'-phosphate oxidase
MDPQTTLDPRFSSEEATPTPWSAARDQLQDAKTYQLTTIRASGRPHQTTIAGIWLGERFSFTTSSGEQKAHNLEAGNHHVIVTAGNSGWAWT